MDFRQYLYELKTDWVVFMSNLYIPEKPIKV